MPPRFDVYRAVSREIHAIFKDYTPLVEPLSLDEAYLDVTDNIRGIATAWETAKEIRSRIFRETDLTASAGISCNKFLAKLASDRRKPNGQFAILPHEAEAFVASLPVSKFHGVGPKTASKMHALGIETGADLRGQTLAFLQHHFGKAGAWYYEIAQPDDEREAMQRSKALAKINMQRRRLESIERAARIVAMHFDGWTIKDIAVAISRSPRWIVRFMAARGVRIPQTKISVRRALTLTLRREEALRAMADAYGKSPADTLADLVNFVLDDNAYRARVVLRVWEAKKP